MAIIDPLDPCLLFYPGELPEDIANRIDGGVITVPNGTKANADPIDPVTWEEPPVPPRPPIDPGEPTGPGGPGDDDGPGDPGGPDGPGDPGGPDGPGDPEGPGGPIDDGGDDDGPPTVIKWKCETITHYIDGFGGTVTVVRKVCTSTTDANAPFNTLSECVAECQSVTVLDEGETQTPTETEPETPGEGGNTPDENDDGPGGGIIVTPGGPQTPTEPEDPDTEYDEGEITYSADAVATLPNYFPTVDTTQTTEFLEQGNQTTIFASLQAPTINYLIRQPPVGSIKAINEKLKKLNPNKIKDSVSKNFADIIYNLVEPDGRRVPDSRISTSLQMYLLQGKARKINTSYLLKLQIRAILGQATTTTRFINYIDSRYSPNQINPLVNRVLNMGRLNATRTTQRSITPNSQRGVARALQSAKSLDYRKYTDAKSEHLKLWNILPEDIYARITVADQDGNTSRLNVKNDLSLLATASGSQPIRVPINNYLFNIYVDTASGTVTVPADSELDRAVTLNNKVEQACLFDSGVEKEYVLKVTSPSDLNIELTYDVSAPRPNHYVLILDASTIQDAEVKKSPFVRTSLANYRLETNASTIQDALKFRIYPWQVMPVYHDDPLLAHFTTSSTYQVEFNDFSLEEFGDDISGPIFIRRIPKAILVLPTDRYDYLIYNGQSRLDDWNVRSLNFVLSPDPNYYDVGLRSSWTKINLAYPNTDIENNISEHGIFATYETSVPIINNTYVNQVEPARTENGFRVAVKVASGLNDAYNTNNGILWSDVYSRLTEQQYKTHKLNISDRMLEKLRKGEKTGSRLVHDKGQSLLTRLTGLKQNKTNPFPIYLTRE